MRIVFMGTPEFSVAALDALVDAGHEVVAAYSQPARPAGRGKKDRPSPVALRAQALGITVKTPVSLRDEAAQAAFVALQADVAVVVAYGLILPQPVLDAPKFGCLNIHASLLPRWRGAAPIQRAIMAGDTETGVCIMQMDAGLDTGPVLARAQLPIDETTTTGKLHDQLATLGAEQIVHVLTKLGDLTPEQQSETGVTYAKKIEKSEARIDWSVSAVQVLRQIHGLSPFPGAWFELEGERAKVLAVELAEGSGAPGQVLDDHLTVACGSDALRLAVLQRAGRGPLPADDFLRGRPVLAGTQL